MRICSRKAHTNKASTSTMRSTVYFAFVFVLAAAVVVASEESANTNSMRGDWMDRWSAAADAYKRRPSDPSDPRNLFSAVYGYRKRLSPYAAYYPGLDTNLYEQTKRRGLKDPLDPRNLFRSVYGFRKK